MTLFFKVFRSILAILVGWVHVAHLVDVAPDSLGDLVKLVRVVKHDELRF